ncbi:3-carboxy-cis,cis-muconate cycloisomerase [Agrobacterium larrymoorei]|uniref:3-carboxy-cis,cis-muconate cycloisomerase n=1 Tax=Agrobacterium larrymoorei TaxID=160699 RepID=UPI001574E0D6|nr:3-carboxy-cis,cis-muconate cycloisomerase [Agrobacterium larrymoorei]NTJ44719.1 3-carboxy-cis,cis-muconate cycloisomerase [Agrobacterium larrymoorei]
MPLSPFDHPFLSGIFGDDEIASRLSADADLNGILAFEGALARAQAGLGIIPSQAADRISTVCDSFVPDMPKLKAAVASDAVVVPELVRQLRDALGGDAASHIHFGATSQDAIDTSLMLRLKAIVPVFEERLSRIIALLEGLDKRFGAVPLMGYTRMQAAIPIRVSDRLKSWRAPLERCVASFSSFEFPVQLGGAAGTLDKLGQNGPAVRAALARELDLVDVEQWHSQRDPIVAIGQQLSLVTGAVGKMGQDIALMAQDGREITMVGGGKSSAMAHKQNPVAAETLVALARYNAMQVSGLHHSLVHEQERSGAAWTLEWMILPQIVLAAGASLRLGEEVLKMVRRIGAADSVG